MATVFEITVNHASTGDFTFDLPVPLTFGLQSDSYISVLAIQPDSSSPPVNATYAIRHDNNPAHQVDVPAVGNKE